MCGELAAGEELCLIKDLSDIDKIDPGPVEGILRLRSLSSHVLTL